MGAELDIVFYGPVRGLAESRLSLELFAPALVNLVTALQTTASAMLSKALDNPDYGARGGRKRREADLLDFELASVTDQGCTALKLVCTSRGALAAVGLSSVFADLPERSVDQLLQDLEQESAGKQTSAGARRYLVSLPAGLAKQTYSAQLNGGLPRVVEIEGPALQEALQDRPGMRIARARIISIGVEPNKEEVRLSVPGRGRFACTASIQQVEQAWAWRDRDVTACFLTTKKPRLLWLRDAANPLPRMSEPEIVERIHQRWAETLRRLAQ